jgi:hypothetical protein
MDAKDATIITLCFMIVIQAYLAHETRVRANKIPTKPGNKHKLSRFAVAVMMSRPKQQPCFHILSSVTAINKDEAISAAINKAVLDPEHEGLIVYHYNAIEIKERCLPNDTNS